MDDEQDTLDELTEQAEEMGQYQIPDDWTCSACRLANSLTRTFCMWCSTERPE